MQTTAEAAARGFSRSEQRLDAGLVVPRIEFSRYHGGRSTSATSGIREYFEDIEFAAGRVEVEGSVEEAADGRVATS
jgi:hypothetical protein